MSVKEAKNRQPIEGLEVNPRFPRVIFSGLRRLSKKMPEVMPRLRRKKDKQSPVESLIDIPSILAEIPTYAEGIKTGEELQRNGRQLAKEKRFKPLVESGFLKVHEGFGKSTEGRDIDLIEIGSDNAKRTVMWVGTPHPNEAVGTLAIDFLSRHLCEHPEIAEKLDTKFVFIPNADPDGLALNESWLKGEMDPLKYALGFYRPPLEEQADLSFPIDYKNLHFHNPSAEAQAIMKAFNFYKPEFYYALHNSAIGDSFFLLSQNVPELIAPLQQIITDHGLYLHDGSVEFPFQEKYAKGIYQIAKVKSIYDLWTENQKTEVVPRGLAGAKSSEYLHDNINPDSISLEPEIPYFTAEVLRDTALSRITMRDALLKGVEKVREIDTFMKEQFDILQERFPDSRLKRLVEKRIELMKGFATQWTEEAKEEKHQRNATNAEAYALIEGNAFYEAIQLGQVYQLALQAGEIRQAEKIKAYIENIINDINEVSPIESVPLQKLVAIQVAAGLTSQQHLALAA